MPRRLRGYAYLTFYRLPGRVRRRLVRGLVRKYTVGAVAVVRDSEAPGPGPPLGAAGRPAQAARVPGHRRGPRAARGVRRPDRPGRSRAGPSERDRARP